MVEENFDKFKYQFPAYSALYHSIDGMIFTRYGLAYKVKEILPDENNRNKKIMNPERLKDKLFRTIMLLYNQRINTYDLLLDRLSLHQKDELEIKKYKLVSSIEGEEDDYSGRHMIFPRTFVCKDKECGDFRSFSFSKKDEWEWEHFDPTHCRKCGGEYEQVSILMFCEKCGKIVPLPYRCKQHGTKNIQLIRKEKDSLRTWKVVCRDCYEEGKKEPIDIFRFTCNHMDGNNKKVYNGEETKFKPLTIREGGIFTPVVLTSIDVPSIKNVEVEDLEYILLGIYLNRFNQISEEIKSGINHSQIESFFKAYRDQNIKNAMFMTDQLLSRLPPEEKEEAWKKKWFIDIIEEEIKKLKEEYANVNLERLNDYFAIKGVYSKENSDTISYSEFIESIDNETRKKRLRETFDYFKNSYGIRDITYISDINLISSCIGLIYGINKFYELGFVPHFSPIWTDDVKKEKMVSYSYPFETEGVLIELDRVKVCNWLIDNGFLGEMKRPTDGGEAANMLLKIGSDSKGYAALKTLIHTLSHALIRRSSLYTGLDSDSCGELLFTNNAAFLIYATSNINIGGFAFVFEHSLMEWFREIKLELNECTFDPTCIFEKGACFSCMYLPEYVCSEFNKNLDRDVFLGSKRYKVPYWGRE